MRFIAALLCLVALVSPFASVSASSVHSNTVVHSPTSVHGFRHVGLARDYHPNEKIKAKHKQAMSKRRKATVYDDTVDITDDSGDAFVPPATPTVTTIGVIQHDDFNPIADGVILVEFSGTPDGVTVPPFTIAIDYPNSCYHYSCLSGDASDPTTWTSTEGTNVEVTYVPAFYDEYTSYGGFPRGIPRQQCPPGTQTQVHIRYGGAHSGNIQCTPTGLLDSATALAVEAGCLTGESD